MKRIFTAALVGIFCLPAFAINEDDYGWGIGAVLMQDSKSKTYIVKSFPGSPASEKAIPIGSEIISVNGKDVKALPLNNIVSLVNGIEGTSVDIAVKNKSDTQNYTLRREIKNISVRDQRSEQAQYWKQVAPIEYIDATSVSISGAYSRSLKMQIEKNNYWAKRKEDFDVRFNYCKSCPEYEHGPCLTKLITKEFSENANHQAKQLYEQNEKDILIKSINKSKSDFRYMENFTPRPQPSPPPV